MPPVAFIVASITVGAILIVVGLWLLRASAMPRTNADPDSALPARGMSFATRAAVGLSLMIAGYHAAAWGTPDGWIALKVPLDRWYFVAGGIVVAVGASLAMDRVARRHTPASENLPSDPER